MLMLEQCNKEPRALDMYDELTERLISAQLTLELTWSLVSRWQ